MQNKILFTTKRTIQIVIGLLLVGIIVASMQSKPKNIVTAGRQWAGTL